jgi:hypothetical protein
LRQVIERPKKIFLSNRSTLRRIGCLGRLSNVTAQSQAKSSGPRTERKISFAEISLLQTSDCITELNRRSTCSTAG